METPKTAAPKKDKEELELSRGPSERFRKQLEEKEKRLQWERENPPVVKERKKRGPRAESKPKGRKLLKRRSPEEFEDKAAENGDHDHEEHADEEPAAENGDDTKKNGRSESAKRAKPAKGRGRSKSVEKKAEGRAAKGKSEEVKDRRKSGKPMRSSSRKVKPVKDEADTLNHKADKTDKEPKGRKAVKNK